MWHDMNDGCAVQRTPDGWRVRNPDGGFHHVIDRAHTWPEGMEASACHPPATIPRVIRAPGVWTKATDLLDAAGGVGLGMGRDGYAATLRRMGAHPQKKAGVRGWVGVDISPE